MTKPFVIDKKNSQFVSDKIVIGRKEKVNLPELFLMDVVAKMDTGAFTSSLHCTNITTEMFKNKKLVFFNVFDENKKIEQNISCVVHAERQVKSSNGQKEKRYVISTTLQMGGKNFETEFTLTDRSEMKNQILIGRKALGGRFLVDVSKTKKRSIN
jgi:hypothetical protein